MVGCNSCRLPIESEAKEMRDILYSFRFNPLMETDDYSHYESTTTLALPSGNHSLHIPFVCYISTVLNYDTRALFVETKIYENNNLLNQSTNKISVDSKRYDFRFQHQQCNEALLNTTISLPMNISSDEVEKQYIIKTYIRCVSVYRPPVTIQSISYFGTMNVPVLIMNKTSVSEYNPMYKNEFWLHILDTIDDEDYITNPTTHTYSPNVEGNFICTLFLGLGVESIVLSPIRNGIDTDKVVLIRVEVGGILAHYDSYKVYTNSFSLTIVLDELYFSKDNDIKITFINVDYLYIGKETNLLTTASLLQFKPM